VRDQAGERSDMKKNRSTWWKSWRPGTDPPGWMAVSDARIVIIERRANHAECPRTGASA
jgi:hypothetical protein